MIMKSFLAVGHLHRRCPEMLLAGCRYFNCSRPGDNATSATIKADPAYNRCIPDHSSIYVHIAHYGCIDAHHRGIIPEHATAPSTANISYTNITVAVVYAAIKANRRAPVTMMEAIIAAIEAPIAWSP